MLEIAVARNFRSTDLILLSKEKCGVRVSLLPAKATWKIDARSRTLWLKLLKFLVSNQDFKLVKTTAETRFVRAVSLRKSIELQRHAKGEASDLKQKRQITIRAISPQNVAKIFVQSEKIRDIFLIVSE